MTPGILAKKLAAAEGSEPKYGIREQESSEEEDNDLSLKSKKKRDNLK
jgi:protein phosphatase inhibitor 2